MRRRLAVALLLLWIVAHMVAIDLWLRRDHRVPRGDQIRYLTTSSRIAGILSHPTPDLVERVFRAHPEPHPPLFATVAAPFLAASPEDLDAPVRAQWLFVALLAIGCYGMGACLRGPGTGLLTAVLALTTTHVAIFEHLMMLEVPLMACVAAASWAWLASDGFRRRAPTAALGAVAAVGVLVKWNFAFAFLGPLLTVPGVLLAAIASRWRTAEDRGDAARRARNVALGGALFLAGIAPWAILRGNDFLAFTINVARQDIFHAGSSVTSFESLTYFWKALDLETSVPFEAAFRECLVLLLLGLALRRTRATPVDLPRALDGLRLLLLLGGTYLAISLVPTKESRYVGPLLPSVCATVAFVVTGLRIPFLELRASSLAWLRAPFVAALVGLGVLGWLGAAFDVLADDDLRVRPTQRIAIGPFDLRVFQPDDAPAPFLPERGRVVLPLIKLKLPPDPRDLSPRRALDAIDRDRGTRRAHVFTCTPQEMLHASAFGYLAEALHPGIEIAPVREYYVARPIENEFAAFSPYDLLAATHVLLVRRRGGPDAGEAKRYPFSESIGLWIESRPEEFRKHFALAHAYEPWKDPFDSTQDLLVEVYRRVAPPDDAEIAEVLRAIESFDRLKPGTWVDVALYHYRNDELEKALDLLTKHVPEGSELFPVHQDFRAAMLREIPPRLEWEKARVRPGG